MWIFMLVFIVYKQCFNEAERWLIFRWILWFAAILLCYGHKMLEKYIYNKSPCWGVHQRACCSQRVSASWGLQAGTSASVQHRCSVVPVHTAGAVPPHSTKTLVFMCSSAIPSEYFVSTDNADMQSKQCLTLYGEGTFNRLFHKESLSKNTLFRFH